MPLLALNSHLGVRRIGDTLTFYAETTSATGLALDADAVPGYRIYEGETGTAIATGGVMALLDSSNTAGLYSEQITLTFSDPPGYEFNKDYVIYLTATISGVAAAAIYTFKIGPEAALYSGVASAGAAGTITLTGTPATNDILNGTTVAILSGTGAGQSRVISDYTSGLVASVIPNWITNPDSTSVFAVYPYGQSNVQQWRDVQPNALSSGRVDANVTAMAAGVITATVIATDAIDADAMAANAIDAAVIATGAITAAKFAAGAIDAAAIADGAIDAATLATGTITAAKFAAGAIDAAAIADGAIDAATLATGTITAAKFAAGAIDAAAIANAAIDAATFAAGAIDAAAIATGAIDADALATDAVTEIWAAATRTLTAATNITSTGAAVPITAGGLVSSDVTAISTDTAASDSLETMLDGTGGNVLTLAQLRLISAAGGGAIDIDNSAGPAIVATAGGAASHGILIEGAGSGDGFRTVGGATGNGHHAVGGATSGIGFVSEAVGGGHGFRILGVGSGLGASIQGGATAHGVELVGGASGSRVGVSFVPSGNAPPVSGNLGYIRTGTAQAGAATTITLDAGASADDDIYNGNLVFLTAGTGGDQARIITDYDGTSKVATVSPAWTRAPDATSVFSLKVDGMVTTGAAPTAADVANAVWDEPTIEGRTVGSYGQLVKDDIDATISSRASAAQATAIQADTDDIQTRLTTIQSDTDDLQVRSADIQGRLPATLHGGLYMKSQVYGMETDTITSAVIQTAAIDADAIAADAIGASELAADAASEIGTAVWAAVTRTLSAGAITTATFATGAIDANAIGTAAIDADAIAPDAIGASELAADAATEIGTAVWAAATRTLSAGAITTATFAAGAINAAAIADGAIDALTFAAGAIDSAAIATGAIDADALSTDAAAEIAGAVWEEPIVNHKVPGTFGQANNAVHSGTAQAGAATTITLAAGASAIDDFYNNAVIFLTTGTGADQIRTITDYNGTTKVATVATWATNPSATTTYVVLPIIGPTSGGAVPTASEVADAVWDELTTEGRFALSYGQLLKDDINATISSRASAAQATAIQADTDDLQVSAASIQADTNDIQARLPATLAAGDRMRSHVEAFDTAVITDTAIAANAIGASELAADAATEIGTAVWAAATRTLSAGAITTATFATGAIDANAIGTGAIDADAIAPDAIGASELAADAATEIGTAVWVAATRTLTAGAITSATFAAGAIDNAAIAADAIGSSELAATAVAEIADQVWEEAIADHSVTVGSTAEALAAAGAGGTPPTVGAIADAVWDEIASGHVVSGSFGQRLQPIHAGTATAGGATSITLDAGASGSLQFYRGMLVHITGGTGAGQARTITSYSGGTQIATVSPSWVANPASGSVFVITPQNSDATIIAGAVWDEARGSHIGGGTFGEGVNVAPSGIAAASFVAGAIDAAAIATDAIGAAELAASAVTEIQAGLATAAAVAAIQADTDDLQLSAASIQADTNDIQLRLPATLTGAGRMRSHVEAFDPDVINAAAIAPAAIDAATFAAGAIDAAAIANGAIDAATFASGAIDAAAIGTGAIDADALATDAVAEIADGVWDEDIVAAHGTADTAGETVSQLTKRAATLATEVLDGSIIGQMLDDGTAVYDRTTDSLQAIRDSIAAAGPSAAVIANAVWDEPTIEGRTVGSYGQLVKDDLDAAVSSRASSAQAVSIQADTDDIQARLTTVQADTDDIQVRLTTIQADTDDLQLSAASIQADTNDIQLRLPATLTGTGRMRSQVEGMDAGTVTATAVATGAIDADALATDAVDEIVDQVWNEALADHLGLGSTGEALSNAGGGGASPAVIAAAVWDRDLTLHALVNSAGEALDGSRDAALSVDVKLTPARAANLDNLDVLVSSRSTLTATQAADQVWDEQLGDHLDAGSTGEALDAITVVAGSTPAQVAVAVWDELKANHQGDTIMGNMAQDLDNLEFSGEEG